ncbi:hypothetical protein E2C01_063164 [Portunus trituberculatus]|uniref:Uncharacterized protein n=1 Tax=Portunus trituberculatus TaxID=210409 RepID=A0A5B7H8G7_PORTR|nr:hypothetical protein [Portunus trituberculatus]
MLLLYVPYKIVFGPEWFGLRLKRDDLRTLAGGGRAGGGRKHTPKVALQRERISCDDSTIPFRVSLESHLSNFIDDLHGGRCSASLTEA